MYGKRHRWIQIFLVAVSVVFTPFIIYELPRSIPDDKAVVKEAANWYFKIVEILSKLTKIKKGSSTAQNG